MSFNWSANTLIYNWNSVSINSTGQNAVAYSNGTTGSLYYYNNNSNLWTISTYDTTGVSFNQSQISISTNNAFIPLGYSGSTICYYYSTTNGEEYDLVTSSFGGQIPISGSINSNGIWVLCCNTLGYPYTGNITNATYPYQLDIFEDCISYCALSDGNYGFICANAGVNPTYATFNYSSAIDIFGSVSWTQVLASTLFGSSQSFIGISCSGSGQYIIVGTDIGVYVSSNGTATPPTFTEYLYSNVSCVSVSKSGQYGLFCQNPGAIYYSNNYLQTWSVCTDSSLSNQSWSSVSISDENNYKVYAVASVNELNVGGDIYNVTIDIPIPPAPAPAPAPAPSNNVVITTIPNPIIAGQPAVITYQNSSYLPIPNNNYVLKNQLDVTVSSVYTGIPGSITFTFRNVYLIAGLNELYIYNLTSSSMSPTFNENAIQIEVSSICFKEGTYILCYNKGTNDKYIPIEQLNESVYVKTNKHGYKKVKYLIKTRIINSSKKTINKLYVMKKSEKNGLIEDLYVTGSHALLKDELSEKEEKNMDKLLSIFKDVKYEKMIDDKYKVLACFDKRFEEYNEEGYYNIYHIVLEDDKGVYNNYGIYANGILAESTMEDTLSKLNNYDLINIDKNNVIIEKSISIKDVFLKSNSKAKKYLNNRF
jgi:hypothetical protein